MTAPPPSKSEARLRMENARDPLRIIRDRDRGGTHYQSDAFSDCICGVIQRIQDLDLPAITSREPESAETWARTADYFRRLNRCVPFTEDELSGLLADTLTPNP